MSLASGNKLLASDINSLKAKVKKEMLRRDGRGSLVEYGGTTYDYSVVPAKGGKLLIEHANKIITPMNAITASGFTEVKKGDRVKSLEALNAKVVAYAAESMGASKSSCSSSCSGLCTTSSSGSCGCSGSCGGVCSSTTDGSCTCGSGCKGSTEASTCSSCSDGCTAYCGMSCYGTCSSQWNGGGSTCAAAKCSGSCIGEVISTDV